MTKKDLEMFKLAVAEVVSPLHVWAKDVNKILKALHEGVVNLDKRVIGLSDRMDKHVFDTEKKVSKNEHLLGSYTNDFVSTKVFNSLEKRVEKLELAKV